MDQANQSGSLLNLFMQAPYSSTSLKDIVKAINPILDPPSSHKETSLQPLFFQILATSELD